MAVREVLETAPPQMRRLAGLLVHQAAVAEHLTQAVQAVQVVQVDLEQAVAAVARHQTDSRLEQAEQAEQGTQSSPHSLLKHELRAR
jgi:hypothetical protein